MTQKINARQILIVVAVMATIVVNILANALPINGKNTGEISDSFDVFFVPAGYVFSIWGLIYIGLIAFAIYQALPRHASDATLRDISLPFIVSSAANIAWIYLWHYEIFPLTLLAMLVLLASLVIIYLRLDIGRRHVSRAFHWCVHIPFSIYLGWITVATIANATSLLDFLQWQAWGIAPEAWTVIMLAAAVIIGGLVALRRGDVAFLAVLIWAFAGIAIKHDDSNIVSAAAWSAAALTALLAIAGSYRHRVNIRRFSPAGEGYEQA